MYVFRGYTVFSEMLSQYPGHTVVFTDSSVTNKRTTGKIVLDSITV